MTIEKKKKKSIFKRWWFWVVLVILIGAIASGGEDDTTTAEKKEAKVHAQADKAIKEADKAIEESDKLTNKIKEEDGVENDPGISAEEFDKIQAGMTYEEVVEIIGGEGEMNSESGSKGDPYYTVMYTWKGEKGFGANANATFQGSPAKLQNKSQFGLK